jgi:hypothetical protein
MNKLFVIASLLAGLFFWSCAASVPGKTSSKGDEPYSEDLSNYRAQPSDYEEPTVSNETILIEADSTSYPVNERLNTVLDTAAAYSRKTINYIDGFTIQVYAGNDRSMAKDFQIDIIRNFPESEPKMVFEQPNYKVRVGNYYTRLEGQQFFTQVKTVYPRAILIPTRFKIN